MALVRHPNLQSAQGRYLSGHTVTAVTDRTTDDPADAYTSESGLTSVTYPVTSGAEGEVDLWVPPGSYESTFGDDTVDEPAVWEAVVGVDSGEVAAAITALEAATAAFEGNYVDVKLDYGAVGDGVTDDTAAIQAAFDYVKTTAAIIPTRTVYFPLGIYKISPPGLMIEAKTRNLNIVGDTRGNVGSTLADGRGSCLRYVGCGPGDPALLSMKNAVRWRISDIHFEYDGTDLFDGDLLYLDGHGAADPQQFLVERCSSKNRDGLGDTAHASVHLYQTIIGEIVGCGWSGCDTGIYFDDVSYNNAITVRDCMFHSNDEAHILIGTPNCESLTIENNTFEGGTYSIKGTTVADGYTGEPLLYGPVISGNWFGDNSGETHWVYGLKCIDGAAGMIANNMFNGCGSTGTYIYVKGQGNWISFCNTFRGTGSAYGDSSAPIFSMGNDATGGLNSVFTTEPTTGDYRSVSDFTSMPKTALGTVTINRSTTALDVADDNVGNKSIIIGHNNTGTPSADVSTIYGETAGLALQSPNTSNAATVELKAGTTPATKFAVNGNGVGFNAATPQAKPTITGSRGGNAALASLLTELADYGLITDGTSA